jgi:dipeptidyl aminopeptidase/acylaminoacyl peptidase
VDVEDVCAAAQHLVAAGAADPDRLCIDGGSAGGYTTLACLAFTDVFKAGASMYGCVIIASNSRHRPLLTPPFASCG